MSDDRTEPRLAFDQRRFLRAMRENDADAALDIIVSGIEKHRQKKRQTAPTPDAALPASREIPKEPT